MSVGAAIERGASRFTDLPRPAALGIFAMLAAGIFPTIEAAQQKLCLPQKTYTPEPGAVEIYEKLYQLYRRVYFGFGEKGEQSVDMREVFVQLRKIAAGS